MREPPTNICPLLAIAGAGGTNNPAVCIEGRCAWWDYLAGACCMASEADYLRAVSDSLETLAAESQALMNLQKKTPAGAANTDEGGVEQNLTTVSTSDDT